MSIQSMVRPISDSFGATMATLFSSLQAAAHSPQPVHFCKSMTIPHFIACAPCYLLAFCTRTCVDSQELRPLSGSTRRSINATGFVPMFLAYRPDSLCPDPKGTPRISEETVGTTFTRKMTDPFPDTTRIGSPSLRASLFALSGCISAQGSQYTRGISPDISCKSGWLAPSPVMFIRVVKGARRKESGGSVFRGGPSNRLLEGVSPFCVPSP